jgi:hypothetical protein
MGIKRKLTEDQRISKLEQIIAKQDHEIELLAKGFLLLQGDLGLLQNYPKKIIIRYEV